ncbi:c-type cytochrome [Wenxinia marina]|uniref:Cytochrome c553 n=1 Tax=Wenxinia marina DSM 24838 TaxID=1123501 RepID=A0A0D0PFD1_9RHOB|nr:hypothetical protein [Wenxinia marina]KIQ70061.1 Cytochrome c553 [Wenxinia marina DSM 24838]GGL63202.1 hypothetical protein GCM10011392_17340 [Wenxinia marina]
MRPILTSLILLSAGAAAAQELEAPPGALSCTGCHGPISDVQIAGMDESALAAALTDYRAGTREGTVMNRLAAGLTDAEIAAIAAWFAAQEVPQ